MIATIKNDNQCKASFSFCSQKALIIIFCLICLGSAITPLDNQTNLLASGKVVPQISVLASVDGQQTITQAFSHNLFQQDMKNFEAFVSLISFDCYVSYEFSFNATVVEITTTQIKFSYKVIGLSYFTLISFHYAACAYNDTSVPNPTQYFSHQCFLCTNLTAIAGDNSMTFQKVKLGDSNTNGRYEVVTFIAGIELYNQYQELKAVKVSAWVDADSTFVKHKIQKNENSTIKWICLNTVIVDRQILIFKSYQYAYMIKNDIEFLQNGTLVSDNQDAPQFNPNLWGEKNMRVYGFSSIFLQGSSGNQKFLLPTDSIENILTDRDIDGVGAVISLYYAAERTCSGREYCPQYQNIYQCYDSCPEGTTNVSSICQTCHYTCETCTQVQYNACGRCNDTNNREKDNSTSTCPCKTGYVDTGNAVCQQCLIPNCKKCATHTQCDECNQFMSFDTQEMKCKCSDQNKSYFNEKLQQCWLYPGCTQGDQSNMSCTSCDQDAKFQLKDDKCQCIQNYTLNTETGKCQPQCGDGQFMPENNNQTECDDGGTEPGDGCSSDCQIQEGFGCFNEAYGSTSLCAPLRTLKLKYIYTQRKKGKNEAILVFKILKTNAKVQLSQSDFKYSIQTSIPYKTSSVSYDPVSSLIEIDISYTQSLEQATHTLKLSYDYSKVSIPSQQFNIRLKGSNSKLTYDENLETLSAMNILSIVVSILIVTLFFALVFFNQKLPATELMLSSQTVFFAIFAAGNNVGLGALKGLRYLNGYNQVKTFEVNMGNYEVGSVLQQQVFKQFILNFNFMGLALIFSVILILPFKMNIWKLEKQKNALVNMAFDSELKQSFFEPPPTVSQMRIKIHEAKMLQKAYINKFYYPVNLMCLFQVTFFFGIQNFSSNINNQFYYNPIWSLIASIFALLLCQGFFVYLFEESNKAKSVFFFMRKIVFYPFHMIFIYYFVIVLFAMTLPLNNFSLYIISVGSLLPLAYRLINSPYPVFLSFPSLDSLFKSGMTVVAVGLLVVVKNTVENAQMICIGILALLFINFILSFVRLGIVLCKKYRSREGLECKSESEKSEIEEDTESNKDGNQEEKQSVESDTQEDQEQADEGHKKQEQVPLSKLEESKLDPISEMKSKQEQLANQEGEQEEDQDNMDQLALVKKRLREDLKKKRGRVTKLAQHGQEDKMHKK